jgi:hypothetical protein
MGFECMTPSVAGRAKTAKERENIELLSKRLTSPPHLFNHFRPLVGRGTTSLKTLTI